MRSSSENRQSEKLAFDFYQGYLAVIYGLVATKGLEYLATFPSEHESLSPTVKVLFLGTFLVSFHFWYVCATTDDLSQSFYRLLAGPNDSLFQLLFVFDALVATAFAGWTYAMFKAVADKPELLFQMLLWVAGLSLGYDLYALVLTFLARRTRTDVKDQVTISAYGQKIDSWIKGDCLFVLVASGICFLHHKLGGSLVFAVLFACWAIIILLLDVELIVPVQTSKQRHLL
jgi:hypothetical protein